MKTGNRQEVLPRGDARKRILTTEGKSVVVCSTFAHYSVKYLKCHHVRGESDKKLALKWLSPDVLLLQVLSVKEGLQ